MYVYARDSATFFFLPRSNSTHYHKRDLPLITQTNVGLLSLHFQLRRKAKSWLKMLSLLDILPTAGFEFQVISFTWPGSTELEVQINAYWFCSFTYKKRLISPFHMYFNPIIRKFLFARTMRLDLESMIFPKIPIALISLLWQKVYAYSFISF